MNTAGAEQRLIDGRFELLQQLGGGGMGLVWRARDNALQREVVVKEVRPPDPAMAAADPAQARQLRERVLREARALARLQHPNVVVIHHIVDTPDHPHPWLVMELVAGGSLADRLAKGPLGVAEAARIGRGVLSALRAAHAGGIQHRDVKPGNVLLRPDDTPVLADFGIAAIQDATALTATGALIGSPEYIAPERIRGQEGNPSSDLWSLGMMLYVAVEGRHPLRRATTLATLAAVLDEPLPPPARAGRLGPLLTALLAKDPAVRPDAEQLDRMLAAAEHDDGAAFEDSEPQAVVAAPPPGGAASPADRIPPDFARPPTGQVPLAFRPAPGTPAKPSAATRRGRVVAATGVVTAVVLAGVVALLLSQGGATAAHGTTAGSTTGTTTTVTSSPGTAGTSAPAVAPPSASPGGASLLTPDGVRRTIDALHPYLSGGKVFQLVIYPDYAIAQVPTAAGAKVYDEVNYRDGKAVRSVGGELMPDEKAIDLQDFDWDVLPALLQKAQDTLNVAHPTSRYLIIEADMFDGSPSTKVYLSDDYGSGYLEADLKGNVTRTYPRSS
ncbi:serine/threonine-protein kinase [Saccharothrix sp. ST-888]|uniref:serine/threonine-protein kinase n=1 Tax=Saccharothrix sp. ST-888 TaxID=1427391 RepID=UPI0005ED37FA|nr:serine/threonine-protein kinase [Saccharothrix sp. ST-888]KJK58012.1 hypothetical protein UK12_13060 [Saccharothrix sp. ST-888]